MSVNQEPADPQWSPTKPEPPVLPRTVSSPQPSSDEIIIAETNAINLLLDQGDLHQAEVRLKQALAELLPSSDTRGRLWLEDAAGRLMISKEDGNAAYPHYKDLLARCRKLLGGKDPETLNLWVQVGNALILMEEFSEAESELRAVVLMMQEVLGPEDRVTIAARAYLADACLFQEKYDEAEQEQRAALEISLRVLGPEHPDTLSLRHGLAVTLNWQDKLPDPEAEWRALLALSQRVHGPDHQVTLHLHYNLATVLNLQADPNEAKQHAEIAYQGLKELFGSIHPDTVTYKEFLDLLAEEHFNGKP